MGNLIYDGRVVGCDKCKKLGPFEEMSPYTHGWFGFDWFKHKDCGGKLGNAFYKHSLISNDKWNSMSPAEREDAAAETWGTVEKNKQLLQEIDKELQSTTLKDIHEIKYNDPNLTCPMCGSHVVKKLTVADRAVSVAAWGLASGKIGKQYECKKCGHKW